MTYKTREIKVEAWKYNGTIDDAPDWIFDSFKKGDIRSYVRDGGMLISTPLGAKSVKAGDYIIHDTFRDGLMHIEPQIFECLFNVD